MFSPIDRMLGSRLSDLAMLVTCANASASIILGLETSPGRRVKRGATTVKARR